MSELKESIEKLYSVFFCYPLAEVVEGCTCCVDVKDHLALREVPLRDLPAENLTHYVSHALTTWGTEEDFKHFLPRIFELLSVGNDFGHGVEIVICRLGYAKWQEWPEYEKKAIRDFLMTMWKQMLFTETTLTASDWMCSVGIIGEDLQPYLNLWVEAKSKVAYRRLFKAINDRKILDNAFWGDEIKAVQQIVAWLESKDTSNRLIDIYFENEEADFVKPLLECIDVLSAYQK